MRKPTTREWVLIAVLVIAASIVWLWDRGSLLGGGQAQSEANLVTGQAPVIDLARLEAPAEDYNVQGRDIFKYGPPPAVKRAPVKRTAPPPPPPTPRVTRQAPKPSTPTKREPQPPRVTFKYTGKLGSKDNPIAVFYENEGPPILAQIGEVVQEQFKLLDFGYSKVILGYTDERFEGKTTELAQENR